MNDETRAFIQEEVRRQTEQNMTVLFDLIRTDKYVFSKLMKIVEGKNIQLGTSVGTQIGTATTQKVAFLGATPVSRQSSIASPSAISGTYVQAEVASIKTAVDALITTLETFGFIAPN